MVSSKKVMANLPLLVLTSSKGCIGTSRMASMGSSR